MIQNNISQDHIFAGVEQTEQTGCVPAAYLLWCFLV